MQHKQSHGMGRLKKALFYAKVTTAAVLGTWFAFQPLASSAQATPQEKTARAPAPSPRSKEKTISFSDAQSSQQKAGLQSAVQQKRNAAQLGGRGPPLQEYDSTHPYAGVRSILVALADQPDSAQFYAHKYVLLVDEIAAALQGSMGASCAENRQRMAMLWKIMQSRFSFANDTKFISNSLMTNLWDCDNSAAVAYDVLRKLGFSPETIILSGHFLLTHQGLDFETKTGEIYSHDSIGFYYPPPVAISGIDAFIALAYFELGNRDSDSAGADSTRIDSSLYGSAIRNYKKAISLNYNDPNAHANLGLACAAIGQHESALQEFSTAIELSPQRGKARFYRAMLYHKLGREAEAEADMEKYTGVKGVKIIPR